MKQKKNQSGSMHLIIIVVVVVLVIIGALGYVLYDKYLAKKKVSNTTTATTTELTINKTLVISEWGIRGQYSGDAELTYDFSDRNNEQIEISSEGYSSECEYPGTGGPVISLERKHATDMIDSFIAATDNGNDISALDFYDSRTDASIRYIYKIGDTYYLRGLFSTCGGEQNGNLGQLIYSEVTEFLANAETI